MRTLLLILLVAVPLSAQNRLKFEDFQHLPPGDCPASIAVSGDNLIIAGGAAGGPAVRALAKGTGTPVWSQAAPPCPTVAATTSSVFVRGQIGSITAVIAYDAITGAFRWSSGAVPASFPTLVPQFAANENAVVTTDRTTATTQAFDPIDGHPLWSANIGGHVAIDGFSVYVATFDPFNLTTTILRSYDARTGNVNWEYIRPNTRLLSMATAPNRLFLGGNFLAALETGSGDILWQDTTWGGFIGTGRGMLGVASGATVRMYQAESGALLWSDTVPIPEPWIQYRYFASVAIGENGAYFAGALGAEPYFAPTAFRAYDLDRGYFLYEDIFNNGGILSLPQKVIRDGQLVLVSGDAVLGPQAHNLAVRAYEFGDVETSHPDSGIVGRGVEPAAEVRTRVRR